MSVKIKISYESPEELQDVLDRLKPLMESCKIPGGQQNKYKKAYIILKRKENS